MPSTPLRDLGFRAVTIRAADFIWDFSAYRALASLGGVDVPSTQALQTEGTHRRLCITLTLGGNLSG
jgi:hypothetical protein